MSESNNNDGGPAFPMASGPEPRANETTHYNEGMTLRDYFAAKIASGLASYSGTMGFPYGPLDIASRSYEIADAMITKREEK